MLVAAGADTELADCDGRRPADYAEDSDVRQLLGAPSLALHDAAEEGDAAAVGALLQADPEARAVLASFGVVGDAVRDALEVTAEGKIGLERQMPMSTLDLKIGVKLDKGLKDLFGSFVDSGNGDGRFSLQVRGTVGAPVTLKS